MTPSCRACQNAVVLFKIETAHKMQSSFEQHRDLLTASVSDAVLLPLIAEAGARQSWWRADRTWKRTYGSFDPLQTALITLLFETEAEPQEICHVEIFAAKPEGISDAEFVLAHEAFGWLKLTRFPHDAQLPTLASVLKNSPPAKVLRYRPRKRCTIRFEARNGGARQFAKIFPDERGRQLHEESLALWQMAQTGVLQFNVARPCKWEAATRTLWQEAVPGAPIIEQLKSTEGVALAERLGRAAASLAHAPLGPHEVLDAHAQLQRTRRYAEDLCRRVPSLQDEIDLLLARLAALHAAIPARALVPIHGSPHPQQWLVEGERLGLVDFDRFSWGDPELDVATFIAEMDFEDQAKYPVEQINRAFIAGYETLAGELRRDLLAAYRAHKQFSKALKAARSVRPDGETRAAKNLKRAIYALSENFDSKAFPPNNAEATAFHRRFSITASRSEAFWGE